MGKRSAVVELFLGDMGSIQRETRPSIQREDQLTMETKLEQIAVKARCEPKLRFTSLATTLLPSFSADADAGRRRWVAVGDEECAGQWFARHGAVFLEIGDAFTGEE